MSLQPVAQPVQKARSSHESEKVTTQSAGQELSYVEESDPSYENLELTQGEFMKRQKLSTDDQVFTNRNAQASQLPRDIPMRNVSFAGPMQALSEGKADEQKDLLGEDAPFNIDDVLIDRSAGSNYGGSYFLGLGVMCAGLGMASFM